MKEHQKIAKNIQVTENDAPDEDRIKCSSCESTNVEIYSKNDLRFLMCLDCGRKELFD